MSQNHGIIMGNAIVEGSRKFDYLGFFKYIGL